MPQVDGRDTAKKRLHRADGTWAATFDPFYPAQRGLQASATGYYVIDQAEGLGTFPINSGAEQGQFRRGHNRRLEPGVRHRANRWSIQPAPV